MKKILVLVATGFEDTELVTTVNILERNGFKYTLASVENKTEVKGQLFAKIDTVPIEDVDTQLFDALFLPGGNGRLILENDSHVIKLVKQYNSKNIIIAAICAAPNVLLKAGILKNRRYTSFPGVAEGPNKTSNEIEHDENIITGKNYLSTVKFAEYLAEVMLQKDDTFE